MRIFAMDERTIISMNFDRVKIDRERQANLDDGRPHNDAGLDWYNYGARFYDPTIGRFTGVDPLAQKYSFQNPYAYAANNPIRYIDFMGMGPGDPKAVKQSSLKAYSPKGRTSVTLTQQNSYSIYGKRMATTKVTQTTSVTLDPKGNFISGRSSVTKRTIVNGTIIGNDVISSSPLLTDENGNIVGIGGDLEVAVNTVKEGGIEGGIMGPLLSDGQAAASQGVAVMWTAAELKTASKGSKMKFGLFGKIMQAFGLGTYIGGVMADADNKTVTLNQTSEKIDYDDARSKINTLTGENEQ